MFLKHFLAFVAFLDLTPSHSIAHQGAKLVYDYESQVQLKQGAFGGKPESRSRQLSMKFAAKLAVTNIWRENSNNQTLLKVQVLNAESLTWYGKKSVDIVPNVQKSLEIPFFVHFSLENGVELYSVEKNEEILNLQRGFASLFIFKQENVEIDETDVLGQCKTKYVQDRHGLHKNKENCQNQAEAETKLFGTRKYTNMKALYKLQSDSGIIDTLEVREWIEYYHNLTPELAQDLQHRQKLTLKEQSSDTAWSDFEVKEGDLLHKISELLELDLKRHGIQAKFKHDPMKATKLKSLVSHSKKHFKSKSLSTKESAQVFVKILGAVDHATKEDVITVLKDKNLQEIMPQFMDVIGASSNLKAHEAAFEMSYVNPSTVGKNFHFWRIKICQNLKFHDLKVA